MYCVCDCMILYVSVEFSKYFVIDFVAQYPLEKVCIILSSCTNAHILYLPFLGEASHDSKLQKQCLSTRYVLLLLIQLMQGAMMYCVIFVLAEAQEVITMDSSIFLLQSLIFHSSSSGMPVISSPWGSYSKVCGITFLHYVHIRTHLSC